jgi:hypothetical protein
VTTVDDVKVRFVAGFGPIVANPGPGQALVDARELPLTWEPHDPNCLHVETLDGVGIVTRLPSPEGRLVGVTFTPWMR